MPRRTAHYEMDMTQGPLLGKIIRFSIPLILTGLLQLLYNAADIVVVGRFAGSNALAAVSSTSALINVFVYLFMGLSMGGSVLVAREYGAGNMKGVSEMVHNAIALAIVSGLLAGALGMALCRPMLELMGSPEEVREMSVLYLKIYFAGSLFNMLYNFGAAILRAVGDTRRPMYYLTLSGVVNVALNLLFVLGLRMSVAGVALATVASQALSAVLVLGRLLHAESAIRLRLSKLRIQKDRLISQLKIGFPAGLQATISAGANVLLQSAVNSFGADVMAGNGASGNIEGFIFVVMHAFYTAVLTFTSQNVGAKKPERIGRIMLLCQLCSAVASFVLCMAAHAFGPQLLGLYSTNPNVVEMGMVRMSIICSTYFLCGVMDTFVGGLRGMGNSLVPMFIYITGACVFRIIWIYGVFPFHRTLPFLYLCWPISWIITGSAQAVCFLITKKRLTNRLQLETA